MSEKNEPVEQKAEVQQETPKGNGGYRMADLEKVMTPVEITQVEAVRNELNSALAELDKLKKQSDNLEEWWDQVFNHLSLGNIDGYINLLTNQVKPLLVKIKEIRETIKKLRTKQKDLLKPIIQRLDNINSKEPFKPQEVLRCFTAEVKAGENTPKKGSYTLSRHDALALMKELSGIITGNPKAQRIEIFIASN